MESFDLQQMAQMIVLAADDGEMDTVKYLTRKLAQMGSMCVFTDVPRVGPDVELPAVSMPSTVGSYDGKTTVGYTGKRTYQQLYRDRRHADGFVQIYDNGSLVWKKAEDTAWVPGERGKWKRVVKWSSAFRKHLAKGGCYLRGDLPMPTRKIFEVKE